MFNTTKLKYKLITQEERNNRKLLNQNFNSTITSEININEQIIQYTVEIDQSNISLKIDSVSSKSLMIAALQSYMVGNQERVLTYDNINSIASAIVQDIENKVYDEINKQYNIHK